MKKKSKKRIKNFWDNRLAKIREKKEQKANEKQQKINEQSRKPKNRLYMIVEKDK